MERPFFLKCLNSQEKGNIHERECLSGVKVIHVCDREGNIYDGNTRVHIGVDNEAPRRTIWEPGY